MNANPYASMAADAPPPAKEDLTEAEIAKEKSDQKVSEFMHLWFRFIVTYNTHFVLHELLERHKLKGAIDSRPSVNDA